MLDKVPAVGISKNAIRLFESYLAEDHFTVEIANWDAKYANINVGICKDQF